MKKTCLFIDDGDDLDAITERLINKGKQNGLEISCFVFNPMSEEYFYGSDFSMNLELVVEKLSASYLRRKIDLVACDYQLGDKLIYGDEILKRIRHLNKNCSFILYSGALVDVINNLVGDKKNIKSPEMILENIQGLINSKISKFIRKGNENLIIDESINILKQTPMEQILLNNLLDFEEKNFNGVFPEFNGRKISEIINFLKQHSYEGERFSNEIIEQAVSLTVDIKNVRQDSLYIPN